jgi:hypothetical protein
MRALVPDQHALLISGPEHPTLIRGTVKIRRAFLAIAAAFALSAAVLAPSGAAMAVPSPLGTYPVCDGSAAQLCLSANGTLNYEVFGKYAQAGDNQEETTVSAANVCGNTDVVDGNGSNCPFVNGSGFNTAYAGDLIVQLHNTYENNRYFLATDQDGIGSPGAYAMQQGAQGDTGYEWVLAPAGTAGWFYLISVYLSDGNGTEQHACTGGVADPNSTIYLSSNWASDGSCKFEFES